MGIFLILAMSQGVSAWSSTEYLDRVGDYVDIDYAQTEYKSVFLRDAKLSEIVTTNVSVEWVYGNDHLVDNGHWEKKVNVSHTMPLIQNIETCDNETGYTYKWELDKNVSTQFIKERCTKTSSNLIGYKNVTEETWTPFNWDSNAYEIRWVAKLKPMIGFRSIDHIPTVNEHRYENYSWWNTTWSNRDCFNVSNPFDYNLTNITIDISLNMSAFDIQSNCFDVRWADQNQALGFWNSSGCFAGGTSNTTWWVNIPIIDTTNLTQACLYYNNSDTNLTPTWSISEAGIFGDDFDDGNIESWVNATLLAGSSQWEPSAWGGSVSVANGKLKADDDQEGAYHEIDSAINLTSYRILFRTTFPVAASPYNLIELVAAGSEQGFMQYARSETDTITNYKFASLTKISEATGVVIDDGETHDIEFGRTYNGTWFHWMDGDMKSLATNTADLTFTHFENLTVGFRYADGETDHVLLTKWCEKCVIDRQSGENVTDQPSTSNLDILFTNSSFTPFKTLFDEGENFFTWWNWIDDDDSSPLDDTVGMCNYTVFNGNIDDPSTDTDFTLCDAGVCDIQNPYSFEFAMETNNTEESVVEDTIVLDICHTGIITNNLDFEVWCNGIQQDTGTISSNVFGDCAAGSFQVIQTVTGCEAWNNVTVVFDNNAVSANRGHTISEWEYNRRLVSHLNTQEEGDLYFNSTENLWASNHSHKSYIHGLLQVDVDCVHNTQSGFDNSGSENITIVNIAPVIAISEVQNSGGTFDLFEGVVLLNHSGVWMWLITYTDDDPDTHNITWYNGTGDVIHSQQNENFTDIHDTPAGLFDNLANPYNVSTWANDTTGAISILSITFNVSAVPPVPVEPGLINATFQWDLSVELPIRQQFCDGNNLVTIRERTSCDGTQCLTINQTDTQFCAYGCEENITKLGADCVPTAWDVNLWGWTIVIIAFSIIFGFGFVVDRVRGEGGRRR